MAFSLFTHVHQSGARLTVSASAYAKQLRRIHAREARNRAKQETRELLARIEELEKAAKLLL